jgi:hypothetical protein
MKKLNAEDWIGFVLSCIACFLAFVLTLSATGSINLAMGAMAIATSAIGGAYFAVIGYVERIIVPRLEEKA